MVKSFKINKSIGPRQQYLINKSIILNYIMENSKFLTRVKIATKLGISPPTVSKIIDEFISEGYVKELGKDDSTGGKKAIRLGFNAKNRSLIGVDLGKDRIRIAWGDLKGNILEKHVGFKIYYKDKDLLDKVIAEIKSFIDEIEKNKDNAGVFRKNLLGLCIGIPADIDPESGKIISTPLFESWEGLNIKEIFSKYFDIRIYIENSKNLSALGEKYLGLGTKHRNFVILEVGEGIGAGIVIDNQLYKGATFSAGEVGFMIGDKKKLYSSYKLKGYMENMASPNVLKRDILKIINSGEKTIVSDLVNNDLTKITPAIVCKAANMGDKHSKKIIKKVVENLATIVLNLILVINPEIIVISGDLTELPNVNNLFTEPIKKLVSNIIPFDLPIIENASLGVDAGISGCLIFALNNLMGNKYPYKILIDK